MDATPDLANALEAPCPAPSCKRSSFRSWTSARSSVEVQAPISADWITAVGSDETMTMTDLRFLTVNFQGVNVQYIAVNPNEATHDDSAGDSHTGKLLQGSVQSPGPATNMFVPVTQVLQAGIEAPLATDLSEWDIGTALAEQGIENATSLAASIHAAIQ